MRTFDTAKFFNLMRKLPQLSAVDPRRGCVMRTQIVGSLLHNMGFKVSRAWVFPVFESTNFLAPLYDRAGKPLRIGATETHSGRHVFWRYHCASCLPDVPGQPVFDFPLFNGPVRYANWQKVFRAAQKTYAAAADIELRIVIHGFHHIPERQALRHNQQAVKCSDFFPDRRLAKITSLSSFRAPAESPPFRSYAGESRLRKITII